MATHSAIEQEDDVDPAEAKRLRKAAKRAALETLAAEPAEDKDVDDGKSSKKAARQESREASAAEQLADGGAAAKKAAKRAAHGVATPHDAQEAEVVLSKKMRKASTAEELADDGAAAKKARKVAKSAADQVATPDDTQEAEAARSNKPRSSARVADDHEKQQDSVSTPTIARTPEEIEERSQRRKERKKKEQAAKKTRADDLTVFVSGIPFDFDEGGVRDHFGTCGEIDCVKILMNKDGKSRGLAYVSFKTEAEVKAGMKLDTTSCKGKQLSVKPSKPKLKSDTDDLEVFVKHFPRDEPDDALRKVFGGCGEIESLRIPRWDDGAAKGMAFIVFTDFKGLKNALKLDGKKVGDKWIEVKKSARPSDEHSQGKTGKVTTEGGTNKKGKGKGKGVK